MKKFGLAVLGITAAIVVLANLGSLLALALSALIAYAGFHYYRKSESTFKKIFWGSVLLIGLFSAISNVPAFIGIIALIGVLYVWRKWKGTESNNIITNVSDDPFVNFERQWDEITK
ncbi:ABC transporter permease [Sporosarcina sp. FSL K6-2383]|uniref:lmo0954 family membrane protein n=1 Tax=Sporosarcina sp. FSL K6-2383 TaxID=2921556 RepID=UPI00315B19F2